MTQKAGTGLIFDFPKILRECDIEKGEKRLSEVVGVSSTIKAAIGRARKELMMVRTIKRVEGLKNLDRIHVSVFPESGEDGGDCHSLSVECYLEGHAGDDDYDVSSSEAMSVLLCDAAGEIFGSDLNHETVDQKQFIPLLAAAILGKEEGKIWLAEREAAEIGDSARKTKRSVKAKSL